MKGNVKFAAVVVLLVAAVLFGAAGAEADVKFVNKTGVKVYVAVYTDGVFPITNGWYGIEPGKTWVSKNPVTYGYYAFCTRDKKKVYWKGNAYNMWIHPTKKFNLDEYGGIVVDGGGGPKMEGVTKVGFRSIKLNDNGDATVNLTIK